MTPEETKIQLQRLMYMLNNNEQYYEILKQDPSKFSSYGWNDEEDKILWAFKFNPASYSQQVKCLMRYKCSSMIKERMQFIGADINEKMIA